MSKRLKLSTWETFCHYSIALLPLLLGFFFLIDGLLNGFYVEDQPDWSQPPILELSLFLIVLGLWGIYKQYRRLLYKYIPLENLSPEFMLKTSKKIFIDHSWKILKENENLLITEGASLRSNIFDIRTYGNRITLLYEDDILWMNCIPLYGQVVTFGKMDQLYRDFTDLLVERVTETQNEKA